jgi:HPt (histidine-containing phosphotransfer) domain-containing protein
MTLEELYAMMGGNYERAKQIMKMDKLIDRYIRKLKNSSVDEKLSEACETMDGEKLFESAHALKGVCANLGLDDLAAKAETITEEFRPGSSRTMSDEEVKALLQQTLEQYQKTLDCIGKYEQGS